jgi:hypothetical protein
VWAWPLSLAVKVTAKRWNMWASGGFVVLIEENLPPKMGGVNWAARSPPDG